MIDITYNPIPLDKVLATVTRPECGAEVLFVGTTRQWTAGVESSYLEYESYFEMALKMLGQLEAEARRRWPLVEVAIVHRLGRVEIGQASVAVAVGAAHREAAFEAARWLIDQIKDHVPIWKREHDPTNSAEWLHPK